MLSVCLTDHVLNLPGCNPVVSQGGSVLLGLHLTDEETEAQGQRRIGPGRPMAGSRLGRAWTQHGHWRPDGQGASVASAAGPVAVHLRTSAVRAAVLVLTERDTVELCVQRLLSPGPGRRM